MMKRLTCILSVLAGSVFALAQTPQEIVARMDAMFSEHEQDGVVMMADTKVPVLGNMTVKTYALGNKSREETSMKGVKIIVWSDGVTSWEYNSKDNEVTIKHMKTYATDDDDMGFFSGIIDGYDLTVQKETADAWYILCKKNKSNKEKDAPKSMDLVVSKKDYRPVNLSFKMSGVSLTLRDISFGVTEKQVTFNPADYPGAKIIDKR